MEEGLIIEGGEVAGGEGEVKEPEGVLLLNNKTTIEDRIRIRRNHLFLDPENPGNFQFKVEGGTWDGNAFQTSSISFASLPITDVCHGLTKEDIMQEAEAILRMR